MRNPVCWHKADGSDFLFWVAVVIRLSAFGVIRNVYDPMNKGIPQIEFQNHTTNRSFTSLPDSNPKLFVIIG